MLKPYLLLSAVVLVILAPIAAPAPAPQQGAPAVSKNPVKATADSQSKAKKLYAMDCALCHGDNGDGKTDLAKDMQITMLDWTDSKSLSDRLDQELFNIIRHGKGKMPAEEPGRAKDDEVWNLIIYIRGMGKAQPATPASTAGVSGPPAPSN
jgi:mono/diheme cytochrome c family protein